MNLVQQAIDRKIAALKSAAGIRSLSEFFEIGREKQGPTTTVLEICFEEANGQSYIRYRTTSFSGSGRSGRSRRSYTWPIRDPMDLSDLAEITGKVIASTQPEAEFRDPRSGFGRFFDRLTGSELINDLPNLAQSQAESREALSAYIRRDKYGQRVHLQIKVPNKATRYLTIPYTVWEALDAFVRA